MVHEYLKKLWPFSRDYSNAVDLNESNLSCRTFSVDFKFSAFIITAKLIKLVFSNFKISVMTDRRSHLPLPTSGMYEPLYIFFCWSKHIICQVEHFINSFSKFV